MKRINLLIILTAISLLFIPTALAQDGINRRNGWSREDSYQQMYDPDTVMTIVGTIVTIYYPSTAQSASGVHLRVETADGSIPIHLGPFWYLNQQNFTIAEGDQVEVTGSKVIWAGEPTLIAAEIHKGDQSLTLRDQNGLPIWRGRRRQ